MVLGRKRQPFFPANDLFCLDPQPFGQLFAAKTRPAAALFKKIAENQLMFFFFIWHASAPTVLEIIGYVTIISLKLRRDEIGGKLSTPSTAGEKGLREKRNLLFSLL